MAFTQFTNSERQTGQQEANSAKIAYRDLLLEYLNNAFGGDGSFSLTKFGQAVNVSTSFNRPANTIAYNNLDSINSTTTNSGTQAFSNAFRSTYGGTLQSFYILTNKANLTAQIRVYVYSSSISNIGGSIYDDNAVFAPTFSQADDFITWFDMPPLSNTGGFSSCSQSKLDNLGILIPSNTSLNFHFQIISGAFTPDSGQSFFIGAIIDQN